MIYNAITNSFYSEKNQEVLLTAAEQNEFTSLKVAGFKQWLEAGRVVKKGQKATKIMMVVDKKANADKKESKDKSDKKFKVVKYAAVFFEDQTEELKQEVAA